MLKLLLMLGIHGVRHKISQFYLDMHSYKAKQAAREAKILEWMHNNGIGA